MFNILLCKIDKNGNREKVYTIATEATEADALKTAQHYSRLYQAKGLYNNMLKPSHIVTYSKA